MFYLSAARSNAEARQPNGHKTTQRTLTQEADSLSPSSKLCAEWGAGELAFHAHGSRLLVVRFH